MDVLPVRRRALLSAAVLGTLLLTGCGGQSDGPPTDLPEDAALITIVDFEYETTGTIEPGAEVTVYNDDTVGHTVTADEEGLFDVEVGAGETATFTAPDEPGEYSYYCIPHPQMVSTLVVGG